VDARLACGKLRWSGYRRARLELLRRHLDLPLCGSFNDFEGSAPNVAWIGASDLNDEGWRKERLTVYPEILGMDPDPRLVPVLVPIRGNHAVDRILVGLPLDLRGMRGVVSYMTTRVEHVDAHGSAWTYLSTQITVDSLDHLPHVAALRNRTPLLIAIGPCHGKTLRSVDSRKAHIG